MSTRLPRNQPQEINPVIPCGSAAQGIRRSGSGAPLTTFYLEQEWYAVNYVDAPFHFPQRTLVCPRSRGGGVETRRVDVIQNIVEFPPHTSDERSDGRRH